MPVNREILTYTNTLSYLLSNLLSKMRGITTDNPGDTNNEAIWDTSKGWVVFKDASGHLQVLASQKYYNGTSWVYRSNKFANIEVDSIYTDTGLIDQYLMSAINISETGESGLTGFTATSIVGALNELKDEIAVPDSFWKALSADTIAPKDGSGYDYIYTNSGLKDLYATGIPVGEAGQIALTGFTATSIIGAFNELYPAFASRTVGSSGASLVGYNALDTTPITVQVYRDKTGSALYGEGGLITENSALDGSIDISQLLATYKTTDDIAGTMVSGTLAAESSFAIAPGLNIISADYNAGVPQIVKSISTPNRTTIVPIGRVYKDDNGHLHIWQCGSDFTGFPLKVAKRFLMEGLVRDSGVLTTESSLEALHLAITSGILYNGMTEFNQDSFDSGLKHLILACSANNIILLSASEGDVSEAYSHGKHLVINSSTNGNDGCYHVESVSWDGINTKITIEENTLTTGVDAGHSHYQAFQYWHYDHDTTAWVQENQSGDSCGVEIDVTYWNDTDSSTEFDTFSPSSPYGVHWVYLEPNGTPNLVYGQGEYTLAEAIAVTPPSSLPDIVNAMGFFVAKIVFEDGAVTFYDVYYPWTIAFSATGATSHGGLSGLTADDHSGYLWGLGRAGGQELFGSTLTGESLTLSDNSVDNNSLELNNIEGMKFETAISGKGLTLKTNANGDLASSLILDRSGTYAEGDTHTKMSFKRSGVEKAYIENYEGFYGYTYTKIVNGSALLRMGGQDSSFLIDSNTVQLSALTTLGVVLSSATGFLSSVVDLPDGITATTQDPENNSTKLATTAYVIMQDNAHTSAFIHSDIALNTTHRTSEGSDHGFIDQSVVIGSDPEFSVPTVDGLQFDLSPITAGAEGKLRWHADDGALEFGLPGGNVSLQIGQELVVRVVNKSGALLENGKIVQNTGSQGNSPSVEYASADAAYNQTGYAMLTEDIADNDRGYATFVGMVRGLDTSSWVEGTSLYLSTTLGGLTDVAPDAPNHTAWMGVVLNSHAVEGIIYFKPNLPSKLNNLSDVNGTTPDATNKFLVWNDTNKYWDASILSHTWLTDIGTNTHAQIDTHILNNANFWDKTGDVISPKTAGDVVKITIPDADSAIRLVSTDPGTSVAGLIELYRNSSSAAMGDELSGILFSANTDLNNTKKDSARIYSYRIGTANINGLKFDVQNGDTMYNALDLQHSSSVLYNDNFTLESVNSGVSVMPVFNIYRNSPSAAIGDILGRIQWIGRNAGNTADINAGFIESYMDGTGAFDGAMRLGVGATTMIEMTTFSNTTTKIHSRLVLTNGTYINEFSTDGTLAGNSDDAIPTEKAIKTYVDGAALAEDFWDKTSNIISPKTADDIVNISVSGVGNAMLLESTDPGALAWRGLELYRNSASIAQGDILNELAVTCKDAAGAKKDAMVFQSYVLDTPSNIGLKLKLSDEGILYEVMDYRKGRVGVSGFLNVSGYVSGNFLLTDGNIGIPSDLDLIQLVDNGVTVNGNNFTLESVDAGASAMPVLKLYRNSPSAADGDTLGRIQWVGRNALNDADVNAGFIEAYFNGTTGSVGVGGINIGAGDTTSIGITDDRVWVASDTIFVKDTHLSSNTYKSYWGIGDYGSIHHDGTDFIFTGGSFKFIGGSLYASELFGSSVTGESLTLTDNPIDNTSLVIDNSFKFIGGSVGINSIPDAVAMLDISSTTQGVIMPRMTDTQMWTISSPPEGLEVWNTTYKKKFWYNGEAWVCECVDSFTNKNGSTLYEGAVVVASGSYNLSVMATTTADNLAVLGVIVHGGADGTIVTVATRGLWDVLFRANETADRGECVYTSSTSQHALADNVPQAGCFGKIVESGTSASPFKVKCLINATAEVY